LTEFHAELIVVALGRNPDHGLETVRKLRRAGSAFIVSVGPIRDPQLIVAAAALSGVNLPITMPTLGPV
jgi:hypothetical protein